jgi:hypothetical protein
MLRWPANEELTALLRRYYTGEAGLWPQIREYVQAESRRRGAPQTPQHLRFRPTEQGYDVIIEDASTWLRDD